MSERYALMAAERASFPVRLMARLLGVSASGLFSWASSHGPAAPPPDPWAPLRAEANDVRLSVGRTGSCHDNAVAESFFASLKNEMYHLRSFATRAEARVAVIEYVEGYYNRRRPHSTVGYRIPAELMDEFFGRVERAFAQEGGTVPLAA